MCCVENKCYVMKNLFLNCFLKINKSMHDITVLDFDLCRREGGI